LLHLRATEEVAAAHDDADADALAGDIGDLSGDRRDDVETVFVPTSPEWSFLASSLVKEVAAFGGDVSGLVPDFVREALVERLAERDA